MLQPIALNRLEPAMASAVAASAVSRGGALVARMNRANASISWSASSPQIRPLWSAHGVESDTVSYAATELPIDVFSVSSSRLVIPTSFKYASAENDNRLEFWFFQ